MPPRPSIGTCVWRDCTNRSWTTRAAPVERGVGIAVHVVLATGDVVAQVVPDRGASLVEGLLHRGDRGQLLVVDLDELAGILGGRPAGRDHDRDRVADHPHLVGRERGIRRAVHALWAHERERERELGHLRAREHEGDTRRVAGRDRLHAQDPGVREGAAQERGVEHAGELEVVDVAAATR